MLSYLLAYTEISKDKITTNIHQFHADKKRTILEAMEEFKQEKSEEGKEIVSTVLLELPSRPWQLKLVKTERI